MRIGISGDLQTEGCRELKGIYKGREYFIYNLDDSNGKEIEGK